MTEKPMSLRPRIVPSHIGDPVSFVTGLFGGHTIRVELEEIQGAELGRKYAVVDKRPLDPPPVVLCRFFDELGWKDGRRIEQEVDPDDASLGAICHVDLFAVPPCESVAASLEEQLWTGLSFPASTKFSFPSNYDFTSMIARSPITTLVTPSQDGQHGVLSLQPTITPDIIAYMGRSAIREDAKWNTMLAGGTFVQSSVINHNNKKAAVFVFPDLSVKAEGSFVLRYRVSTITSGCRRGDDSPHPVLAECFGTPFKIYSSKSFPGLRPSTALTKVCCSAWRTMGCV
ncbi:velvet factor-domain-containing protein [Trametes meyenii]|nr:velvet factor-domain-containing protein [Trametes meyenii]